MSNILRKMLKSQIERTFGNDFEEFIKDFFLIYYGQSDFTSTRRVKDSGSDGNISSEDATIACYGPELKATQTNFNKKSKDDYSSYLENWSSEYSNWWFIHNRVNSPQAIKQINSLRKNIKLLGVDELIKMFEDMNRANQRRVANLVNIGEDYFTKQYIKEIVEDILKACEEGRTSKVPYEKPIYIDDKILLNFNEEQVDQAREEFENSIDVFDTVAEILYDYDEDGSLAKLKTRILTDLSQINHGDLNSKISMLIQKYEGQFSYSDDYLYYLKALILYLFEQCLFGIKTEQEKEK